MSSKFGQIRSGTTELAALEHLKIDVAPFFSFHGCGYTFEIVRWAFTGPLVLWFSNLILNFSFLQLIRTFKLHKYRLIMGKCSLVSF